MPISHALKVVTENPARILKLNSKGKISLGGDADLVIFDRNFNLKHVFARGELVHTIA